MLQAANTDLSKAHNSECQNLLFTLQNKPVRVIQSNFADFIFGTLGTNG